MNGAGSQYQDLLNNTITYTDTLNLSALDPMSIPYIDASQNLQDYILTNGQIVVGSTNNLPVATTLTGSSNIIITNGAGSISIDTVQPITPGDNPTFNSVTAGTFTDTGLTPSTLLASNVSDQLQSVNITNANGTNLSFSGSTLAANMTQNLDIGSNPSFGQPYITGLGTGDILMTAPITKQVVGLPGYDGSVLIGGTSDGYWSTNTISGSSNITVTNGAHSITLDTVQGISTSSSPTFANLIDSGLTATTLVSANASKQLQSTTIVNTNGSNGSFAGSTLTLSNSQNLSSTGSPSFIGITLSGATTGTLLCTDVSDSIQSVTLHNTSVNGADTTLAFTSSKNLTLAASNVQDISPAGNPTFESIYLTNTTNQLTLGAPSFETIITATAPTASRTYTLPDAGTNANFILSQGTQTITGTTYVDDLRCSVISEGALVFFQGTGSMGGISLAAGQIPIGQNASTWPLAANITGTSNQIIVTNGSGSITLSTPQSIGTSSVPTFAGQGITGSSFYYSKINTAYTGSTTILVADLLSLFFQFTANTSGVTLTFPTGTALETGISATITPYVGMSFDVLFWNYNSNAVTLASNTGIAFQIMSTSQPGQTARMYRIVRTGTDTYTVYNLS